MTADLAPRTYTKVPPPMVVAATNWPGFHLGDFGSYGWSNSVTASSPGVGAITASSSGSTATFAGAPSDTTGSLPIASLFGASKWMPRPRNTSDSATVLGVAGKEKINAFGNVTGRIGVAFNTTLLYTTLLCTKGGYGWADNKISGSASDATFT